MCNFPDIPYDPFYVGLSNQSIPQGTYTYLKNNKIVDAHLVRLLDGIPDMEKLEECINEMIETYSGNEDKSLYDIFCLIQIWGGNWGQVVFWNNIPFESRWENVIKEEYRNIVNVCIGIKKEDNILGINSDSINKVYNSICSIINRRNNEKRRVFPGINIAFLTKHTRFWLQKNNHDNPLPIFDSVMAYGLFKEDRPKLSRLKQYWNCMMGKATSLDNGMTLLALERQLFNYFPIVDIRKNAKELINVEKDASQTQKERKKEMNARHHRNGMDRIYYESDVILKKIPCNLFVAYEERRGYYCEIRYKNPTTEVENLFLDNLIENYEPSKWFHRKDTYRKPYRYIVFGPEELDKNKAKRLFDKIKNDLENRK